MKLFTEIIKEAQREWPILTMDQLNEFEKIARKSRAVSREYLQMLSNTVQLGIIDGESLNKVINGTPRELQQVAAMFGGNQAMYDEIRKLAAKVKPEVKGLPQFMTDEDFNSVISGQKDVGDITLDLETDRGRGRCARQYAPLVTKIASQFKGCGLTWEDLIGEGQMGLVKAMNDYHRPNEIVDVEKGLTNDQKKEVKKNKALSFKTYAGFRIRFAIMNAISEKSRVVKIGQYGYEKNKIAGNTKGNFNTVSLDQTIDDEGNTMIDRMIELSNGSGAFRKDASKEWEKVYKLIDDRFSTRTASIFYKYFGLHGYKQMKGVEIGKEMGITGGAVSMSVKDVMNFIKSDKRTQAILKDLLDIYSESLIVTNTPETIREAMVTDDVFIMLMECTRWLDAKEFNNTMGATLENFNQEDREFIIQCFENDINFIDDNYDKHRGTLVNFLECLYPTECIRRKSDVDIIGMMNELSEHFKIHNVTE